MSVGRAHTTKKASDFCVSGGGCISPPAYTEVPLQALTQAAAGQPREALSGGQGVWRSRLAQGCSRRDGGQRVPRMGELVEGGEVGREGREGEARCNLDLWKVEVRPDSVDNLRLLVALHISIDGNGNIPQAVSQTNFHFQSLAELSVQLHPSCEVQTSPQPQEA